MTANELLDALKATSEKAVKDMLLPVQKSELSVSKYCMARQVGCNYLL